MSGTSTSYFEECDTREGSLITTIDNLVLRFSLKNISLIKMDIEGFELLAVKGAKETIKKYKPALIICLYHKGQDFFESPEYLKNLVPEYKFRFVNLNPSSPIFERVLIAQI